MIESQGNGDRAVDLTLPRLLRLIAPESRDAPRGLSRYADPRRELEIVTQRFRDRPPKTGLRVLWHHLRRRRANCANRMCNRARLARA